MHGKQKRTVNRVLVQNSLVPAVQSTDNVHPVIGQLTALDKDGKRYHYDWDCQGKRAIVKLDEGTEANVWLEVNICDMQRKLVVKGTQDNVGTVTMPIGDVLCDFKKFIRLLSNNCYIICNNETKNCICAVIWELYSNAMRDTYFYTSKGIIEIKGNNLIMGERIFTAIEASYKESFYRQIDSKMPLLVKGSRALLLCGLDRHILGRNICLELSFALGFYGLFNQILRSKSIPNFILILIGDGHRGKTTTLKVCASAWTHLDHTSNDLATRAGICEFITDNGIIPLVSEDVSVVCDDLRKVIKAYADGRGLTKSGSTRLRHYQSLLLAENESVLDNVNKGDKDGFASRIVELHFDTYTDNHEHASAITEWVGECHGIAGEIVLEHLAKIPHLEKEVAVTYEAMLRTVKELNRAVNPRQQTTIALVLTVGKFLSEVFGRQFRLDLIRETLAEATTKAYSKNSNTKDYELATALKEEIRQLVLSMDTDDFCELRSHEDIPRYTLHFNEYKGIFIRDRILYIRSMHINTCTFTGRSNEKVKKILQNENILVTGEHDNFLCLMPLNYTYKMNIGKTSSVTFYAFDLRNLFKNDENT